MSPQSSGDDYRGVARRKIFSGMAGRSYIKCEKGCELSSQPFVSGKTGNLTIISVCINEYLKYTDL